MLTAERDALRSLPLGCAVDGDLIRECSFCTRRPTHCSVNVGMISHTGDDVCAVLVNIHEVAAVARRMWSASVRHARKVIFLASSRIRQLIFCKHVTSPHVTASVSPSSATLLDAW